MYGFFTLEENILWFLWIESCGPLYFVIDKKYSFICCQYYISFILYCIYMLKHLKITFFGGGGGEEVGPKRGILSE